jgi:hypothetical protein
MPIRKDRGSLAPPVNARVFEGRVAKLHDASDPLIYGPVDHEYRDQSELDRIIDQLPGLKFTLLHPAGLVRDGAEADIIGVVSGARADDGYAVATLVVTNDEALAAIDGGLHELSLGYSCNLDEQRYQRGITLDHLALVPRGRCTTCALRADGDAVACVCRPLGDVHVAVTPVKLDLPVRADCSCQTAPEPGPAVESRHETCACKNYAVLSTDMKDPVMDELKAQLEAALADAAGQKARADQAESDAAIQKSRADQLETDAKVAADNAAKDLDAAQKLIEAEKTRADQAVAEAQTAGDKARTDASAEELKKFDTAVAARVKVLTDANTVLGALDEKSEPADRSAMSNREIKIAIVKHVDGDEIPSDAVDAYVDGMYAGALRRHSKAVGSRVDARTAIAQLRQDGVAALKTTGIAAEKAAQEEMTRRDSTAWMNPAPVTKDQE